MFFLLIRFIAPNELYFYSYHIDIISSFIIFYNWLSFIENPFQTIFPLFPDTILGEYVSTSTTNNGS